MAVIVVEVAAQPDDILPKNPYLTRKASHHVPHL